MVETHDQTIVGLNPSTVYWIDIFHVYLFMCFFEKTKINEKEAGDGLFFKRSGIDQSKRLNRKTEENDKILKI